MVARTLYHALRSDKPLPPLENEPQSTQGEIREARALMEEHNAEYLEALQTPQHFGAFYGFQRILGEPPPKTIKTAQDLEAERRSFLAQSLQAWS